MKKITLLLMFLSTLWSYAQVSSYAFTQTSGVYNEITGGNALGTETSDSQKFVDPAVPLGGTTATGIGFPIGFNFTYNGTVYDRFAVCNDGWISLGISTLTPSVDITVSMSTPYSPLASVVAITPTELMARISGLARDIQGQPGSSLRFETIGVAPNRVLVVQWKNYRKNFNNGDSFNFQIRLNETSNVVDIVYGEFISNSFNGVYQVGMRAEPTAVTTNFVCRNSNTGWGITTPGLLATDAVSMSEFMTPSNGLTFSWTPPVCSGVVNLIASAITTVGATLAWTSTLPAPVGYEYVISSSSTLPSNAGTATVNTTETVSGLNPNTVYYVFLRSNCGTGFTAWIVAGKFKTLCLDTDYINEGFDTYLATLNSMPDCWTKAGAGNAYIVNGGALPGTSPNRLFMYANGGGAVPTIAYAILPSVNNLQANTHRLRFKAFSTDSNAPRFLSIGYFTNPADLSTFNIIETVLLPSNTPSSAIEFIPTLASIPAGVKNLVFRNAGIPSGTTTTTTLYIDDVTWEPIPTCPDVFAVTASGTTSTSVNVAWTAGGTETAWQYVIGASTVTNPNTLTPVDVTSSTIVVNGLTPSTSNKIWIRSNCSTTSLGAWVGPKVFNTSCTPITEFSANFDSGNNFPNCWNKVGTTGTATIVTSATATSQPNFLNMNSNSVTNIAVVAMPPVVNSGAGTHRLRFKYRGNVTNAVLQVGYLLDAADTTTFVTVSSQPDFVVSSTTEWQSGIAVLGSEPSTPNLAFKNFGLPSSYIYIDDVVWEPIPTCPNVTSLVSTGITSTSVSFTWAAGGTETAWQYAYGPTTLSNPSTLTPVDVTSTAITINGLMSSSSYKIWVRSYCGPTSIGVWIGPITFSTTCAPVANFATNFDGMTSFPSCWSKVGELGSAFPTLTPGAPSPDYTLFMSSNSLTSEPTVSMPPVSNSGAGTHRLKFKFRGSVVGSTLILGFLVNPSDANSFVPLETYTASSTTVYDVIIKEPGTALLSQVLAFRKVGSPTGSVFIDDVVWELIPSVPTCLPVTELAVNSSTSSTASISWLAPSPAPAIGYDYYYSTSNTAPIDTTTPSGSVAVGITTVSLSGLTPATVYYVWFRSVCGITDISLWSSAVTFTTACVSTTAPYSQNFETATVPGMPLCSTTVNVGTSNSWTTVNNPGYGFTSKTLQYQWTANAANAWYFTQPVTLVGGTSYSISYKYGNSSVSTWSEKLKVAYGTSASVMTNVLADYPNVTGAFANTATIVFTPAVSGDYYFGFNAYSNANQNYLYVDDIMVQATLATNTFDNNGFTYYPNPVKDVLNLGYNQEITNVAVYNLLGQQVITKAVNANQSQIDMSNLTRGTYLVKVTADNQVKTIKVIKE